MNVKDGIALQMAMKNDYNVIVISGGASEPVIQRLLYLGIKEVHLGLKDKEKFLEAYVNQHGLRWKQMLYMGDDLPDVPVMKLVGLPCCPADAALEVKKISKYISPLNGGCGPG